MPYGTATIGKIIHTPSGWNGAGFAFADTTSGSSVFSMVYNADTAWFGGLSSTGNTVWGTWQSS